MGLELNFNCAGDWSGALIIHCRIISSIYTYLYIAQSRFANTCCMMQFCLQWLLQSIRHYSLVQCIKNLLGTYSLNGTIIYIFCIVFKSAFSWLNSVTNVLRLAIFLYAGAELRSMNALDFIIWLRMSNLKHCPINILLRVLSCNFFCLCCL